MTTPKMIPLRTWADARYTNLSHRTLLRWVRERLIHPAPQKVGRSYHVLETARHVEAPPIPRLSIVEQLQRGGAA